MGQVSRNIAVLFTCGNFTIMVSSFRDYKVECYDAEVVDCNYNAEMIDCDYNEEVEYSACLISMFCYCPSCPG